MKIAINKRTAILFVLGLLALGYAGLTSYFSVEDLRHLTLVREHSSDLINELDSLLASMIDIETGQRGYMITSDRRFLQPFERASTRVQSEIDQILNTIGQDRGQRALFEQLLPKIQEKISFSEVTITLRERGELKQAETVVREGDGRRFMDDIRSLIQRMKSDEQSNLRKSIEAITKNAELISHSSRAAVLMAFLFLILAFARSNADIIRREELEIELRKERERALELSQLKSSFVAHMSHEIRTPMSGVLGTADLLMGTPLLPEQKKFVQMIQNSSQSLLTLLNSVLDLSKIESRKLEISSGYFELGPLIRDVVETLDQLALKKSLKLKATIADETPQAFVGDPLRLRQILLNLLGNAIKFSDQGEIKLHVSAHPLSVSKVLLRFTIHDDGIGISPETRARLFTAFAQGEDEQRTRKFGGTGLGLVISRELAHLMNGSIEFESQLGRGSTFWLTVPLETVPLSLARQSESEVSASQGPAAPLQDALDVLVADDSEIIREVTGAMLERLGHQPSYATNGLEALRACAKKHFDVILMDCHMPEVDGFEATRRLRALPGWTASVPIFAITASAIRSEMEACFEAGMNDYIAKPVMVKDLALKLELWSPLLQAPSPSVVAIDLIKDPNHWMLIFDAVKNLSRDLESPEPADINSLNLRYQNIQAQVDRLGWSRVKSLFESDPAPTSLVLKMALAELELVRRHLERAGLPTQTSDAHSRSESPA